MYIFNPIQWVFAFGPQATIKFLFRPCNRKSLGTPDPRAKFRLTINIVVDLAGIMQQPELVPIHHLASFSICQLMTERHTQMEMHINTLACWYKKLYLEEVYHVFQYIWCKRMFTWQNGDGHPVCLPIFLKRKHRRSPQVSDTPHSIKHNGAIRLNIPKDKTALNTNMKTCLAHQNGDDAFVLLLYHVTNDFVVEVLHCLPLWIQSNIEWRKMLF